MTLEDIRLKHGNEATLYTDGSKILRLDPSDVELLVCSYVDSRRAPCYEKDGPRSYSARKLAAYIQTQDAVYLSNVPSDPDAAKAFWLMYTTDPHDLQRNPAMYCEQHTKRVVSNIKRKGVKTEPKFAKVDVVALMLRERINRVTRAGLALKNQQQYSDSRKRMDALRRIVTAIDVLTGEVSAGIVPLALQDQLRMGREQLVADPCFSYQGTPLAP